MTVVLHRGKGGTAECKMFGKGVHASLIFPFQQLFTIEKEATEIKPKWAVWLLNEKLGLCIECEWLVKTEKKMLLKKFCSKRDENISWLSNNLFGCLWRWIQITSNGGLEGATEKQIMREMQQYPKDALYQVQKNAWCDEWCMLFRVEKMLKRFVKKAPEGIVPYLWLDKYKCHIKEVLQRP